MLKGLVGRVLVFLLGVAVLTALVGLVVPLPAPAAFASPPSGLPAKTVSLAWPAYGQSAIGAEGYGLLARHGAVKPAPIASIAKIITALAVLKKKPLSASSSGPTITLGQADVNDYQKYVSQDGSVVAVQAGEKITERQALEAMLLPSANNMAYSLATWAFGSLNNYTVYANRFVKTLGLTHTKVTDASGFSPATVSTSDDLVRLALATMNNGQLSHIVAEKSASVPVAGTVNNVNWLVGTSGIIGIKTGNTDQAGGCFLFAAQHIVNAQPLTIVGAVMNAPNLYTSMQDAKSLLGSVDQNFKPVVVVPVEANVGSYTTKWGAYSAVTTKTAIRLLVWKGQPVTIKESLYPVKLPLSACETVGKLTAYSGGQTASTALLNQSFIKRPTTAWRALR